MLRQNCLRVINTVSAACNKFTLMTRYTILINSLFLFVAGQANAEVAQQLIVKFKETAIQQSSISTADMAIGLTSRATVSLTRVRSMSGGEEILSVDSKLTGGELATVVRELERDESVEYVELDLIMRTQFVPNDPLYGDQWHYYEAVGGLNLPLAWDLTLATGVVAGVLDTGYRPHVDLVDNILPGYDFVSTAFLGNDGDGRDGDPTDPGDAMNAGECGGGFPPEDTNSSWHGTHVAGTVAATTDNGVGVAGVAPNAKILPLRVLGKCGGYTSDIADAIRWAVGIPVTGVPNNVNPVKVINLSLSSSGPASCSSTYSTAIAEARAAGAVIVVAAGNNDGNANSYSPGNCGGVISVAATNRQGGKASYSNFGTVVDVAALGGGQGFANDPGGILSTANDGTDLPGVDNYLFYQGTSMATPHVTGTVALMFGIDSFLTPDEVETALKETARPFPETCSGCGFGIVDAAEVTALVNGDIVPQDQANLKVVLQGDDGKFRWENIFTGQGRVRYLVVVSNEGPQIATTTVVTNVFPGGVTLDTIVPQQGVCSVDGLICDLGNLAVGESVEIAIEVVTTITKRSYSSSVASDIQDFDQSNDEVTTVFGGAILWLLGVMGLLGLLRFRMNKKGYR